ncbi:Hypothetical predicted protein [Paramuricea clavata]|uniref:Uncharacterized protein n=1 Tax=Paramuricea clavata TaxID=317549 RepID=A0A6S7JBS2_PARCT|nr:Hypothetical predicted protein [Paramuricea clavata]
MSRFVFNIIEDTAGDTDLSNAGQPKPGKDGSDEKNNQGPKPLSRTPDSSHFAVVFLVMIALLFGLYALYHNRQKIIAVVVEGRSINGRGGRERYRKLDSESGLEPEARIKNSNEVYVY